MIRVITLLKSNPGWTAEYVYRLQRAVQRHLTVPHEFLCLTDIPLEVPTLPLITVPEIDLTDIPKFWYKVQLFRPEFELNSQCLFIDLDTVIKNNIDHYIAAFGSHDFLMATSPFRGRIACSYLMWINRDLSHLWHTFGQQPVSDWNQQYHKGRMDLYGDQGFVSEHAEHGFVQDYLPETDIVRITRRESHDQARMLIFGGKRKPWAMAGHPDIEKHWI